MRMMALLVTGNEIAPFDSGGRYQNPVVVSNVTVAKRNLDFNSVWIRHCVANKRPSSHRMQNANFVCTRLCRIGKIKDSIVKDMAGRVLDLRRPSPYKLILCGRPTGSWSSCKGGGGSALASKWRHAHQD